MRFEVWQLFLISILYLGLLFVIATAAEKKWLPESLVKHPIIYTLSLGVYATSWSFYGSVGLAEREGYTFLAVYLGVTIAFMASPILLKPILRLTKEYQLSSLADLLAFRYHSPFSGILVTLLMLTGALPYMALQIQAVTDSLQILTNETQSGFISLGFCLMITLFAILFGARHITPREKHEGLVIAIAFESLVKLVALMTVGLYAVFGTFNGFSGFSSWLENNTEATKALMQPIHDGPWAMMLLLSFSAAFLLPRQFHMIFVENIKTSNLNYASWAFPLFLLLLNISIPPILWAGQSMDLSYGPDLFVLGVSMQSQSAILPIFIFIGGISAASAMIIVTTIALASMCMNHLLLPVSLPKHKQQGVDLYSLLIWGKRILILLIILAGYAFYLFLQTHQELTDLGLISFVAVAQFLPGIFGLLYWNKASRQGFVSGLIVGALLWVITLILPLFSKAGWLVNSPLENIMIPMSSTDSAFWTLLLNSIFFIGASILWPQTEDERKAATACCNNNQGPTHAIPVASTINEFESGLAETIGSETAAKEIKLAISDLKLNEAELDRSDFASLRVQIRHNLSGLIGPVLAGMVVNEQLEVDTSAKVAIADTIQFVEKSLQDSRLELKEISGELDSLRRFHRQVLHDLPLAAVTISLEYQVVSWNKAMEKLTGATEQSMIGKDISRLTSPWSRLILNFLKGDKAVLRSSRINLDDQISILNLFKSDVSGLAENEQHGFVVLLQDHSEIHQLESELAHSERLASIGRLATGVAHEIGNPVTGIACLAQDMQAIPDDIKLQKESIDDILNLTNRISTIVHSLLSYSHVGAEIGHSPETVELRKMIKESLRLVSLSHKGKQIHFINNCPEELTLSGDHQKLLQVLVIVLTNASDASTEGDEVTINATEKNNMIELTVNDSGSGINENILDKIFDPFFTTKQAGEGTGLGLSLAYNIIKEHDGNIEINSQLNKGTQVTIRLTKPGNTLNI
ncbi:MAG: PAS domain S-box protein [Gammaproteobacteria bacterium]|nr:PAS domain S-box protein [Gammaproteobacteria bacterium]